MLRRDFLRSTLALAGAIYAGRPRDQETPESKAFVPVRRITDGPKFHWFGYYDKLEFDPTNRYVLANQVDFEHRSPTSDDQIRVGMVDLRDSDKWTELGSSRAWGWQQGCMLQWRPRSQHEVLWNDRLGDRFVCHLVNVQTGEKRTLDRPIYTVSPDGRWALSLDFSRVNNMRPGYGYAGLSDPFIDDRAPTDSGIWKVDLETGESELIVSLAQLAQLPYQGKSLERSWNYFNHLLVNTDGTRFIFLHRWRDRYDPRSRSGSGFVTRMFTADAEGRNLYELDPSGHTSHFIWRDADHVCAWTKPSGRPSGFYLFRDQTHEVTPVGREQMTVNGHNTYVPQTQNDWILCDTYPQGADRYQIPFLYHVPTARKRELGRFHLPAEYRGEWRCDTHPRCSNDGRTVVIDSPHGGRGRQLWLLDISGIVQ